MNASELDDEKEDANLSIEANSLHISNCGSRFINGSYTRISTDCYVRECTHPITNVVTNIEFRMVDNNVKYFPNTSQNNNDTLLKTFVIRTIIDNDITTTIDYYVCQCNESGTKQEWIDIVGCKPYPTISPINSVVYHFDKKQFIPYNSQDIANPSFFSDVENEDLSIVTAGSIPNGNARIRNSSKNNNDGIATPYLDKRNEFLRQNAKGFASFASSNKNIKNKDFLHIPQKVAPVLTCWVQLSGGLQGGLAIRMEILRDMTVWDIIREITDMNTTRIEEQMVYNDKNYIYCSHRLDVCPWNIRLKHKISQQYIYSPYYWHKNIHLCLYLLKKWFLNCNEKGGNKKKSNISFSPIVAQTKYYRCFEYVNSKLLYQSLYFPCQEITQLNKDTIAKKVKKLIKFDENDEVLSQPGLHSPSMSMPSRSVSEDDESGGSSIFSQQMKDEFFKRRKQEKKRELEIKNEIDWRTFVAERVWGYYVLTVTFGTNKYDIMLEQCCANCQCWRDDLAGARIGYIIEDVTGIALIEQGWIICDIENGHEHVVDLSDENVGTLLWKSLLENDDSTHANLILYKRLFVADN